MIKIAHISDLHIGKITLNLSQFFSKRWIGNINLLFFRKNRFSPKQLFLLPQIFEKLKVNYVVVTGDITSTSLEEEFQAGKNLFLELENKGIQTLFLPGNHDCYTRGAQNQQRFYKYFENKPGKNKIEKLFSLKEDKVQAHLLTDKWWYVGVDCSLATHLISSKGLFSEKAEKNLQILLQQIPKTDFILMANHFPFKRSKSPRRALKRAEELKKILRNQENIKLFLHGHTHHHNIYDLRKKGLPIVLDSGSTAHNSIGKWNFIELGLKKCKIKVYDWNKTELSWQETEDKIYQLQE